MRGQRAIIGGTSDQSTKPGTLQVISYPKLEQSYELQVHSAAVTKMVTNYDNQVLFSGSEDGSFAFI
jgi:hypothetical protein